MHIIQHRLGPLCPGFFVARMPKQAHTDHDVAFKSETFLSFEKLILEASAAAKGYDFIFTDLALRLLNSRNMRALKKSQSCEVRDGSTLHRNEPISKYAILMRIFTLFIDFFSALRNMGH